MSLKATEAKGLASGEPQQVTRALAVSVSQASILRTVSSGDTHALQKILAPTPGVIARAIQVGDENKPALLAGLL